MERRIFWLLSAAIVLLAFVAREYYVLSTTIEHAFSGDATHYLRYADHILLGYFGDGSVPDAYRPPGYPALIALSKLVGHDFYRRLLQWQIVMGTATVALTIGLARQWLPAWAALLAGLLLALWPHHIAFSAEVLSEVPYGFLLTAALLVATVAKDRAWAWACAGFLFACAAMVNTACLLLPFVVAAVLIGRKAPARWIALLAPVVLIVGGWSLRPVDGGSDRIWQNLVQGSHPLYHEAYMAQRGDPEMRRITREISAETNAMATNPVPGLEKIGRRLASEPGRYAAWYASKVWLLWDWEVRIAVTPGVSVHPALPSPWASGPLLAASAILWMLNPVLFVLAVLFAAYAVVRGPAPARMLALAFLYFTAVHVVLQAEPRYSVPYRPIEMLLAVGAIAWIAAAVRRVSPTA